MRTTTPNFEDCVEPELLVLEDLLLARSRSKHRL